MEPSFPVDAWIKTVQGSPGAGWISTQAMYEAMLKLDPPQPNKRTFIGILLGIVVSVTGEDETLTKSILESCTDFKLNDILKAKGVEA